MAPNKRTATTDQQLLNDIVERLKDIIEDNETSTARNIDTVVDTIENNIKQYISNTVTVYIKNPLKQTLDTTSVSAPINKIYIYRCSHY